MATAKTNGAIFFETRAGKQVLERIAEHARHRQEQTGHGQDRERLLSWETSTEFGDLRITVRCDYEQQPSEYPV